MQLTNFEAVSLEGHHVPEASSRLLPAAHHRSRDGAGWGEAIIFTEAVLPKARDRLAMIDAHAPLTEAAALLFEPSCRLVVVCNPAGAMIGVITRTDIIRRIRDCEGCVCATPCMMVMTAHVVSCRPADRLNDVWAIMKERKLHSVPVVDTDRRPIGLLSARDVLEALLAVVEYEERLLKDYVMGLGYH